MTQRPSLDTKSHMPVSLSSGEKRRQRDEKSHYPPMWLWLLFCLAGFLLTGCSNSIDLVNVTEDPLAQTNPRIASILPPKWIPTPQQITYVGQSIPQNPQTSDRWSRIRERGIVIPEVIGYSVEGRPLEVYRFGNGDRNLLIVAGIHGGYEWNTIALADELIEYFKYNPNLIPPDVKLHILRAYNPDGEARAHNFLGRGNANNVDLNRNWNVHWTSVLPRYSCWNIVRLSGGPYPVSEPESKALMHFIVDTEFSALISYHSAGLGIFAGGIPSTDKSLDLAGAIAEISSYPYPPIDIGCDYTGTFIDWAARIGIAAVDIELSTHFYTDLEQNLRILETFLQWSPSTE